MVQTTMTSSQVLTMEEYQRDWEPQGWKLLIIGPTITWRQEWGEWEAIRDIVQNSLDESEAYEWGKDSSGLWIADKGKGIQVADFLLGPPKLKPSYARGKFGEGMKIAALALLRKGYSVRVETPGKEIRMAFLKQKVNGHVETLAALWRPNGTRVGTRFHVIGYYGDAFEGRFAVNIPRSQVLHQGPSLLHEPSRRWNQLIALPTGRIYARDIYLKDIKSPWSYNLWSFEMAPDRHAARSESDMYTDVGRLWATVTNEDLLERFLGMVTQPPEEKTFESDNISLDYLGTEPVTKKRYVDFIAEQGIAWRRVWERKFGPDRVLRTDGRWDGTVRHLGYEPLEVKWEVRDGLSRAIKSDIVLVKESQDRLREAQIIPDEKLTPAQLSHLRLSRKIAEGFRYPRVAEVHAAVIPPASDRMRTAGLYSRITQEIFVALDQLERASWTIDTVIHEIAHHTSGAEDGQESHNTEMTRVASKVVQNTAAKAYDEVLTEAVW